MTNIPRTLVLSRTGASISKREFAGNVIDVPLFSYRLADYATGQHYDLRIEIPENALRTFLTHASDNAVFHDVFKIQDGEQFKVQSAWDAQTVEFMLTKKEEQVGILPPADIDETVDIEEYIAEQNKAVLPNPLLDQQFDIQLATDQQVS
jgi:hypothetical protein